MAPTQSVFMPVDTAIGVIITAIQNAGSAITDFTTGSGARTLTEALATVISQNTATADQLQLDSYLDTATGSALDALGTSNWQVSRNPAVQATGQITITRQSTTAALTLPAGWGQLATTPTLPGQTGIAVQTTQDAVFPIGTAAVTVSAQAVIGGSAGNLSSGIYVIPLSPVNGISSQNGFQVTTAFTNGVDQESDTAYRARIPVTVQGRVVGRQASFLAAALGVPGVLSAAVLGPGATRGDGTTVPAGNVEVYYQGSSGLLSAVESAVTNAAALNQNPEAFASISLSSPRGQKRVIANVTVYVQPGIDPTATGLAVTAALQGYINGSATSPPVGIGNTAYMSLAAEAILGVPGVATVNVPFTTFCLSGGSGAADIAVGADSYVNLAASDVTVTVNTL